MSHTTERPSVAQGSPGRGLEQGAALRAVGQRAVARAAAMAGPGPLVDLDEAPAPVAAPKPLAAAPVAFSGRPVAGRGVSRGLQQVPVVQQQGGPRGVDVKAFTGRGEARDVRAAEAAVDKIRQQMEILAEQSKRWGNLTNLYLTLHVRRDTGQAVLRWRGKDFEGGVAKHRHLTADEASERIRPFPYQQQVEFTGLNEEVLRLNEAEQAARRALKKVKAAAAKPSAKSRAGR